ncbi:MAG TPA: hypothetical protein VIG06_17610, partial [Kofleriaceae bacterium]
MTKRIFLYGGVILLELVLFIVLSDRHVTEHIPVLESLLVRVIVIFVLSSLIGSLIRAWMLRRKGA